MKRYLRSDLLGVLKTFVAIFVICHFSLLTFTPLALAASPTDDYYFKDVFPLYRFIPPKELKVFENKDRTRIYDNREKKIKYTTPTCKQSLDCVAEYQLCSNNVCGEIKKAQGTCKIAENATTGTCNYVQSAGCNEPISASDYSEPSDLPYNKWLNDWKLFDFNNVGSENPITYGIHNLSLDKCTQVERQLIVLAKAYQTGETVKNTGEWPLGWVDGEYKKNETDPLSLFEIWDTKLDGELRKIAINLTEAQDAYILSGGTNIVDVSDSKDSLCRKIDQELLNKLTTVPLYPPSPVKGYARCSICINGSCRESGSTPEKLYTDMSIRGAISSAIYNLGLKFNKDQIKEILKSVIAKNPLLPYTQIATEDAIPSKIATKLKPKVSGVFSLADLGKIYDNQFGEMKKYGYDIQPQVEVVQGGAVPSSIISSIWDAITSGIYLFFDVKTHEIIIPEPMAQSLTELQEGVANTQDTLEVIQNSRVLKTSNIIGEGLLAMGKPFSFAQSGRLITNMLSCDDPYHSNFENPAFNFLDYAFGGIRIGCKKESTQCDPSKFANIIKDSPFSSMPLPSAVSMIKNSSLFINGSPNKALFDVYGKVSQETGVPCELLAGHHFEEARAIFTSGGDPTLYSAANGRRLKDIGETLLQSVESSAKSILNKIPKYDSSTKNLILAISNYNGGGNSNCQSNRPTSYSGCPKQFPGEDDPYAMNQLDNRHSSMYLIFHADGAAGAPTPYGPEPGVFPVALVVHSLLK